MTPTEKLDPQNPFYWWNENNSHQPWLNTEKDDPGNGWVRIGRLDEKRRRSVWLKNEPDKHRYLLRGGREGHDWMREVPYSSPFADIIDGFLTGLDP